MQAHATRMREKTVNVNSSVTSLAGTWKRIARMTMIACCAATLTTGAAAAVSQRSFDTPEAAGDALVKAVKAHDRAAIIAILGPGSEAWVSSGDAVADRAAAERFVSAFDQKHHIEHDNDTTATLAIGPDDWPFAFPLTKSGTTWRFDTDAGKTEMLARRIGANELAAINVMLAIVDAQREYALADHNRDGVREYARRFASSPGKTDGLYWPTSATQPPSPLGPLVTRAAGEGYKKGESPQAYHGYFFRPLLAQGSHAKGGALDYVVRGHMIGGFAAVAYPARYESSGVMTFIVNHDGVVYQKDLGPESEKAAKAMTRFDPGDGWTPVK